MRALISAIGIRLLMTLLLAPLVLPAQVVSEKGTATQPFSGPSICATRKGIGKDKRPLPECLRPSAAEVQALQRLAALNAVERLVARDGASAIRAFDRIRDSLAARYDQIVVGVLELARAIDSASKQVTVNVRADISDARLRDLLRATAAISSRSTAERSMMGMFMLARFQSSVQRFDVERRESTSTTANARADGRADSTRKVYEAESLSGSTVTLDDRVTSARSTTVSAESTSTTARRGTSIARADRVEYTVAAAHDLESAIGSELNVAGYEPVEGALLAADGDPALLDAVRADFGAGDDLKPATLRRMLAAAQEQRVRYVLVGFVESGLPSTDKVSGNQRVDAKVTAKVYDLSGRLPRTVVTVGPTIHFGLGPDVGTARTNAIRTAAEETARAVVDQLSNKQVR